MSELVNSRCDACRPKNFQCTPCSKHDVTVRKQMNALKKLEREKQAPVCLFPAKKPEVVSQILYNEQASAFNQAFQQASVFLREDGQPYPPMPPPAPLTMNGVEIFPPPSIVSPRLNVPFSAVNPFATTLPAVNPFATPTASASMITAPSPIATLPAVNPFASPTASASMITAPTPIAKKLPAAQPSTPKKPAVVKATPKKQPAKPSTTKSTPGAPVATVAAGCKRPHSQFDLNSDSDDSHARAAYKNQDEDASSSSESDDASSEGSVSTDDVTKKDTTKPKMPRITKEERTSVCEWIVKPRPDGKMLNGRWIRNGGAKGATMTATSAQVKTSGAYEALSM